MSFKWKTILGIALIELLFLSILVWQASRYIEDLGSTDIEKRARDTVSLASTVLLDALISYDLASLEEQIEHVGDLEGITYARLRGYGKTLVQSGIESGVERQVDASMDDVTDGVYDVFQELRVSDQVFGQLELGFSVAELHAVTSRAQTRLFTIALLELLLVGLCSWLLAQYLTKRVLTLRNASAQLQAGEFQNPIPVKGNDEVSETIDAFNRMSLTLLEREEALHKANAELSVSNQQLIEREQEVSALLSAAPDGIAMLNEAGNVVFVNRALEELLETDEVALLGQPFFETLQGEQSLNFETLENASGAQRFDAKLRASSGRELSVEMNVSRFHAGDNGLFIVIFRDRTHERELAHAVSVSEQLKANLVDSSLDALITINRSGEVIDFSQSAESLFGWRREEIVGKPMSEHIIPEALRSAHDKGMQHFLATREGPLIGKRVETEARRRNGSVFPVELALTAIWVDQEVYVTASIRDITERKSREEELIASKAQAEEASTAKSRFLSYMSHEIRSPLNAVLGSLSLMQEQSRLDDRDQRYLDLAQQSGHSLLQVVNEILDFSKIEAGHIHFEKMACSLPELIGTVRESIVAKGAKDNVMLRTELGEELQEKMLLDREHLRQVLTILLDNAYKFTQQGEVGVIANAASNQNGNPQKLLKIEVRDTGPGIPAELIDTIFSEFEQVDAMRDSGFGGTGLGLAIARKLVDGMEGTLAVHSEIGVGTTFTLELPFEPAPEDQDGLNGREGIETNSEEADSLTNKASDVAVDAPPILLVDDVEANLLIGSEMLKSRGFRVELAHDGQEAVEHASVNAYSLILMDMRMPRLNGLEATEKIRAGSGPNTHTPIIALTANAEKTEIERCLKAGMNDFVSKPFSIEVLIQAIEHCMNEPIEKQVENNMDSDIAEQYEVLSNSVLDQLARDTSIETVPLMLSVFINEIKKRIQAIDLEHESKNESEIREQAHALKSCAGTFGGLRLQEMARRLEDLASEHQACANPEVIHQVRKVAEDTLLTYSDYHARLERTGVKTD